MPSNRYIRYRKLPGGKTKGSVAFCLYWQIIPIDGNKKVLTCVKF